MYSILEYDYHKVYRYRLLVCSFAVFISLNNKVLDKMHQIQQSISCLILLFSFVKSSPATAFRITASFYQGEGCLEHDGSVVPDCTQDADPVTMEPYYKEHSSSKLQLERTK